jgi:hypothetical protein
LGAMIVSIGKRTGIRRLCGPMLGLLLAVVMVGHDVAMAGADLGPSAQHAPPGADESGSHFARYEHRGVDVELPEGAVARHDDDDSRVTEPNALHGDCGVAPDVVTVVEGARRVSERVRVVAIEHPTRSRLSAPDVRLDKAPTRSPTVRRALIQVYRM